MCRLQMRFEGRAIVIDLVKQKAIGLALRDQHVETPTAGLALGRGAGVLIDQAPERAHGPRPQAEIDDDGVTAHVAVPTTRQYMSQTWSRWARTTRSDRSGSRAAMAS